MSRRNRIFVIKAFEGAGAHAKRYGTGTVDATRANVTAFKPESIIILRAD